FSRGSRAPIRPVEHGTTVSGAWPRSRAASAVEALAVARPWAPVQALAFPALTTTAPTRPPARRRPATWTGAAAARFFVKTPAATAGLSAAITATSGPFVFSPQRTPANRNPAIRTRWARRAIFTGGIPSRARSGFPVALLVLLPAAARAGVVAPDLLGV